MLKYFKYNLKKKNFFFSLVLYFYFLTYNIFFFFQIDIINYNYFYNYFSLLNKSNNIRFMKLNTSNILSIFSKYNFTNTKNIFTIFKRDIFFVSSINYFIFDNINNNIIFNNLIMFCIDCFFINVQYLCNINKIYKLLSNNFNLYKIFVLKLLYINFSYLYNITKSFDNNLLV